MAGLGPVRWACVGLCLLTVPACLQRGWRPLPEAPSQPLPPEPSPTHPYPSVTQSRSIASPPGGAPFAAPLTYQGAAPLVSPAFPGDAGGDRLPLRVSETTHPPEKFGTGDPEPGPTLPAELPLPPEPRARPGPPAPVAEPPEPELVRAMRAYLGKRPDEAVEHLGGLSPAERELALLLLPVVARLSGGALGDADPEELAALIGQLRRAEDILRPRAALEIDHLCLTRRVDKFGIFHPIGKKHSFRPGEYAEVYLELRNFANEPVPVRPGEASAHGYAVCLDVRLEIRNAAGQFQWRQDLREPHREVGRSPRQDYHLVIGFPVPPIPTGRYTLWVTVVDQPTGRSVRRAIDFRVSQMPPPG